MLIEGDLHYTVLTTGAAFVMYVLHTIGVGHARKEFKVKIPNTVGPEGFMRVFRVQQNDVEQLPFFLTSLWLFSLTCDAKIGAGLGFG